MQCPVAELGNVVEGQLLPEATVLRNEPQLTILGLVMMDYAGQPKVHYTLNPRPLRVKAMNTRGRVIMKPWRNFQSRFLQ